MEPCGDAATIQLSLDQQRRARAVARRVALIYFVVTALYIPLSGAAVSYLVPLLVKPGSAHREDLIARYISLAETAKGWGFVVVTAILLYLLVRSYIRSLQVSQNAAAAQLAQVAEEYRTLFEGNPLPTWVFEPATLKILAVNEAAIAAYGFSRDEFLAMTLADIRPPEDVPALHAASENLRGQPVARGLWRHRKKDGSLIDVEITSHATHFAGKRTVLAVAVDITARLQAQRALEQYGQELERRVAARTEDLSTANRQLHAEIAQRQIVEEQLRHAKHLAEAASDAKSSFLARTTHEIRIPLTSILGYAALLLDDPAIAPPLHEHARVIHQNATRLLTLIEDLLDLSRIEAGRLPIRLAPTAPRTLIEEVIDLFRARAAAKNVALKTTFHPDAPPAITTDPARLRQVLVNLVGNALNFTSSGSVEIALFLPTPDSLAFEVRDTGPGIDPARLSDIFTPFYDIAPADVSAPRGAGLGLPISRQLAELLGGTLTAANAPGRGAAFTATFKLHLADPAAVPNHTASPATRRLAAGILVAEDDQHIRWLLTRFLENAGATVTAVTTGLEAVSAVRQAQDAGRPFDLVLLDMHMPGLEGPGAAHAIRQMGFTHPIVALTASPSDDDRRALTNAGCNAVAAKPIDTQTFLPLLHSMLPTPNPQS